MSNEHSRAVVSRALILWLPCILTGVDEDDLEVLKQKGWMVRTSCNFTDFSYYCTPPVV
jgi:hypothetical protein